MNDSRGCDFPTEEMGVQNFNFAPKFTKTRDIQPQMLYFWKKIFRRFLTVTAFERN